MLGTLPSRRNEAPVLYRGKYLYRKDRDLLHHVAMRPRFFTGENTYLGDALWAMSKGRNEAPVLYRGKSACLLASRRYLVVAMRPRFFTGENIIGYDVTRKITFCRNEAPVLYRGKSQFRKNKNRMVSRRNEAPVLYRGKFDHKSWPEHLKTCRNDAPVLYRGKSYTKKHFKNQALTKRFSNAQARHTINRLIFLKNQDVFLNFQRANRGFESLRGKFRRRKLSKIKNPFFQKTRS